jgi:hypothetical protein
MASFSARATTAIYWSIQPLVVAGQQLDVARLRVKLHLRAQLAGQQTLPEWAWLDTGAPFSVIPFYLHHQRLVWQPLAGVQVTWAGQPCDLGTLDIWLPTRQRGRPRGPFPILAKFARSDPPGDPLPLLMGLEFFLTHQAHFDVWPPPTGGTIRIP